MPTLNSTLATMRQGLQDYLGQPFRGTTSGAGNGGGTTFVDATDLINFQNSRFDYFWALLTSGTNSGEIRRVKGFVQSTGTVTVESAYTAQVAGSVTYELMAHHPTLDLRWAINRALQETFGDLQATYTNEDLISGNIIRDSGGEEWTTTTNPTYWSSSGTITFAQETTIKRYGLFSMKATSGANSSYVLQSLTENPPLEDMAGQTVHYRQWVLADTASHARLQIYTLDEDGTEATNSGDYHDGDSRWRLLEVLNVPIPTTVRGIELRITGDVSGGIAYIDQGRLLWPFTSVYLLPTVLANKMPERVLVQDAGLPSVSKEIPADDIGETWPFIDWPHVRYEYDQNIGIWLIRFTQKPLVGRKIRLQGSEYISTVTSDTDVVPLNQPQLNLLYPWAAFRLFERLANGSEGSTREEYQRKGAAAKDDYNRMKGVLGLTKPKRQINFGDWRGTEDRRGRYRYFL